MKDKQVTNKRASEVMARFSRNTLLSDIFIMIICCLLGILCKKMINPVANMITDALHVPGGISTAFSLMFLVIASGITVRKWNATIMGAVQALTALSIGMVGSMGILMPLAYIIPGVVIDLVMLIPGKKSMFTVIKAFIACILSSASAAIFANFAVFHLPAKPLLVYICLAILSGAICGFVAGVIIETVEGAKNKDEG